MTRALLTLKSKADREKAISWVEKAPAGTRVEFKATKRSLPQNDRFWAMLTDLASQLPWHGQYLKASDWKLIFLDALHRDASLVPNIDGTGFVNLGRSSSDLDKEEMSNLIDLIFVFGAEHGVVFQEPSMECA